METKAATTSIPTSESIVFDLKDFFMSNSKFERASREATFELASEIDVISKISKSKKTVNVFIDVNLAAKNKEQHNVFTIAASYMGSFSYGDSMSDEQVQMFAKGNGPAILYPLIRASIASQSVAAEVLPIRMPIVNFFKFPVVVDYED